MAMLQTVPTNLAPALRNSTFSKSRESADKVSRKNAVRASNTDARLKDTIARSFADSEERLEALKEDHQGFGALRQRSTGKFLDSSVIA
jgi:hypothetical protein